MQQQEIFPYQVPSISLLQHPREAQGTLQRRVLLPLITGYHHQLLQGPLVLDDQTPLLHSRLLADPPRSNVERLQMRAHKDPTGSRLSSTMLALEL